MTDMLDLARDGGHGPRAGTPLTDLITPAALVDPDRLDRNIAGVQAAMDDFGVALRPHWKTSKSVAVARRQRTAGAIGFTCATSREVATLLGEPDLGQVLWAHLPVGPAKTRFAAEAARSGRLVVGLDSLDGARALSGAAVSAGTTIDYVVEIETGSGRVGMAADHVVEAYGDLERLPRLRFRGVYSFEGAPLGGLVDQAEELGRAARRSGATLVGAAAALSAAGAAVEVVSVGSTPGMNDTPSVDGITEARPGTYVYYDANTVRLGTAALTDCALTVLARVVSRPRPGEAMIDAGTKSMSSDRSNVGDTLGVVCDPTMNPLEEVSFPRANEEHGWLVGPGADRLSVGDLVRIVPNHACVISNLWSRVLVVDQDSLTVQDSWPVVARY
jgi:D-serine deaminase-like pyridoxal phosphate-dependent protein